MNHIDTILDGFWLDGFYSVGFEALTAVVVLYSGI
jgi:hypothetical protein